MLATLRKSELSATAFALAFVILFSSVLLWPAFLNRYPLIDWDSNAYVDTITHWRGPTRPFPYSVFLLLTSFHRSAWGTVIAQALLVSTINWFTLLTVCVPASSLDHSPSHRGCSTGVPFRRLIIPAVIVVVACAVSALPYYTSLIMPDLFTLTAILALFVLLYTPSRFRAGFAFGLLALSISIHGSNAPILAILVGLWVFWYRRRRWLLACAAIGLGLLLGGAIHKIMTGKLYWRELGSTVPFARLLQDGLIQQTLEVSCHEEPNPFCPYTEELRGITSDLYIWSPYSVRYRIGNERQAAERALIFRSLRLFPVENASAVWRHLVRGFDLTIDTYYPIHSVTFPFRGIVKKALPADVKAFERAIQLNREEWYPEARLVITRLTWVAILLSLVELCEFGIGARSISPLAFGFGVGAVVGGVSLPNAAVGSAHCAAVAC